MSVDAPIPEVVVAFLRLWPPSTMWAGPLIFLGHHQGCLNNPFFSYLGIYAARWAHYMCHHELRTTSVSCPFSSINSSLSLAGETYYHKINIPIFRLVLQNFGLPGCFPFILCYQYLFSLLFSGWVVFAACDSGNYLRIRGFVNWCRVAISHGKSTQLMPSLFNSCFS